MKFATLDTGTRDGCLAVVSRDLSKLVRADTIAPTLQDALDRWDAVEPALRHLSDALNDGRVPDAMDYDPASLLAPLPRAWQWLDGSAFPSHGRLMQAAFKLPPIEATAPLMYQGMSHRFLSGTEPVPFPSETDGIDFEGEFGVITDTVPMGTNIEAARGHIRLVVLLNDWSLRVLAPIEMKTGFGWIQAKPATSMAPVALTPDELGADWADGRVRATLTVQRNGERFGAVPGDAMSFGFHGLIAHAAGTRELCAGTIIGSGTVSSDRHGETGSCCIAERRGIEMLERGDPVTPFLCHGDRVTMSALASDGRPLFGSLDQRVVVTG